MLRFPHRASSTDTGLRSCPPRASKTKALEHLQSRITMLPDDAREIPFQQVHNVQLRIARSTIENAGTGLFLLQGPRPDGSARAGDILGTYEGVRYTDPEDIERLRSPQVESDYLYEATDPQTGTTIIIDASAPFSCYGRYANDGLDQHEANVVFKFGKDGKMLYVKSLTTIDPGAELFASYGPDYWSDPPRFDSLPPSTQLQVKRAYPEITRPTGLNVLRDAFGIALAPPPLRAGVVGANSFTSSRKRPKKISTPTPVTLKPCKDQHHTTIDRPAVLTQPQDSSSQNRDRSVQSQTHNDMPPIIDPCDTTPPMPLLVNASTTPGNTWDATVALPIPSTQCNILPGNNHIPSPDTRMAERDPKHPLVNCFGRSMDDCTRVSLHAKSSYSSLQQTISSLLLGSSREEAYDRLRVFLEQQASYNYWKRIDMSHYSTSIPNGACGWYTIMQLITRHCTGKLLDFSSLEDIKAGCTSLRHAMEHSSDPSTIVSAEYAMDFLRQYYEDPSLPYMSQHELHDSHLVRLTVYPCALFTEQSIRMVRMPDCPSEWIKLTSASCITDPSQDHICLEQAHNLAETANFAILAGHHYWVYPTLHREAEQLHAAILDLATTLWDNLHGHLTPQLLRPSMNPTSSLCQSTAGPPVATRIRQVKVTRYRNGQPIPSNTAGALTPQDTHRPPPVSEAALPLPSPSPQA